MENNQEEKAFLSIRHVEKVYLNGEKAVYDFNLDVAKKEFIVIVGPSGCGKSTTLRMIAGLEDITSGDMYLDDELLNYKPSNERKMAIVFQSYALYPQMNVFDNIAFPLTINKYPMPMCDGELVALIEAKKVLKETGYSKVKASLEGTMQAKSNAKNRTEKLAMLFNVSLEAAKKLLSLYNAQSDGKTDGVVLTDGETEKKWNDELDGQITAKKSALEAEGVQVDEYGYILGEDGKVKIEHRKYTPYEIKVKVYETAEKLDLIPFLDKLPKELSGGQMQRVALGRAIIKNVPVFMMDEPLSNLDAKLRLTMRSEIVKLHNRIGATTIYVTHDQVEAMTMATRIVVMSRGFIQQIGTPEEVYHHPKNIFVAKFIGSPAMNCFNAKFNRKEAMLEVSGIKIPLSKEFIEKHDAFYAAKQAEFEEMNANFDVKTGEKILKLLSTTGEGKTSKANSEKKKKPFAKIKALFEKLFAKKQQVEEERFAEQEICQNKLEKIKQFTCGDHELTIGIRSERLIIQKRSSLDKLPETGFVTKPTICELLGGEYNIHFDFGGKDMTGKFDAVEKISTDDEIVVSFHSDDLYVFDPITGEVIE